MPTRQDLVRAIDLALAGDWTGAHEIVQQDETDSTFCWVHAVLHNGACGPGAFHESATMVSVRLPIA
jgi:hypothetical protein